MSKISFVANNGEFTLDKPENYNNLYFPVAGEKGIKSAISTTLGGDSKITQNEFILEPTSIENLNNNKSSRNFWCCFDNGDIYSITGQSAEAEINRMTDRQDESKLIAGLMWQKLCRQSKKYGIRSEITSFALNDHNTEVMIVKITNDSEETVVFTPVAAIPLYGRSADNLRDHRHVTSLLHRIETKEDGVYVKPTLSFDERGHKKNSVIYYVCGHTGDGVKPEGFYPTVEDFIGLSGSFLWPQALRSNTPAVKSGEKIAGKEALGGLRFAKTELAKGQSACFIIYLGATEDEKEIGLVGEKLAGCEKAVKEYEKIKDYWQSEVNIKYHTGSSDFDNYMRWVTFQPFLRRIYGCSFLPHHDYGRGGRGWRDLWQDCLALLLMNPNGVREMILDNFKGVRIDGTNATIIGDKPGEFKADRNNIPRVWMDHGVWPLMTVSLYIDQTGDLDILNEKVTYFKDSLISRGTDRDNSELKGDNLLYTTDDKVYEGTVLEHLLLQNLCAVYEVGEHGHLRLRGADWNDAIDMAEKRGESVAFTCAYAGNLKTLASYIRQLGKDVEVLKESGVLFENNENANSNIDKKKEILAAYCGTCGSKISGEKLMLNSEEIAKALSDKADYIMAHVLEDEVVSDSEGNSWINSYYDDNGRQVEGNFESGIRMMLTGQVFALMSHTVDEKLANSIIKSAKKYLYRKECGGYRINTDFQEEKYDMGRMFGFAYGEKENGAVFSHMAVMFANSLYKNGFYKEAFETLRTLFDTTMDFDTSKMYPGVPEYFNADGTGLYAYLTGAASWYMMTIVTESFGVRGEMGDLVIAPKLLAEQFDKDGIAEIELKFAGKNVSVQFNNIDHKDVGEYVIEAVAIKGVEYNAAGDMVTIDDDRAVIKRSRISEAASDTLNIMVILQ